jgi:hypothetical protein
MLRRTGSSGEGMQQDRPSGHSVRFTASVRAIVSCALFGAALVAGIAGVDVPGARAQTYGSDNGGAWNKLMRSLGMSGGPESEINYTERSPLVVPPSRDLPPPAASAALAPDWPRDPSKGHKATRPKNAVVPDTAVQTPNPPVEKKPWYNPAGWFNKEEYANFTGEPVRTNLTDPPAGYRIPSSTQPYGISPEKKAVKAPTPSDFGLGSVTAPSGSGK